MPAVTTPVCGRKLARVVATLLAGTAVLFAAAPTTAIAQDQCPGAGVAPSADTLGDAAGAVVCLVNAERLRSGLPRLHVDSDLDQAAGRHSRHMVRRTFFSHVTPSGATLSDRLRRSGYIRRERAWQVGEALAWGAGARATPGAVVAAWIASPPHHRILLGSDVRELGVGVAAGAPQPITGGLSAATYTLDTGVIGR